MTLGIAQVNSGAAFGSGAILPSADVNSTVGDAFLAWYSAVAGMGKFVSLEYEPHLPYVTGSAVNQLIFNGTYGYIQEIVAANGELSSLAAANLSFTAIGAIAFSVNSGRWVVFSNDLITAWYRSTGSTMATLAAATAMSANTAVYAAVPVGIGSDRIIAVGVNGSSVGRIVRLDAGAQTGAVEFGGVGVFRTVASDGGGGLVAVAGDVVVYSVDSGASWSTGTFPTLPVTFDGHLTVSWSSVTGFIASGLLSTGYMFWSTSSTGATWQAWKRTSQVAVATTAPFASTSTKTCGICAMGTVLICPYVTNEASSGAHIVGLLVSINSGASWRAIPGSSLGPDYFDGLCAVLLGLETRVAILTRRGAVVTAPIQLNDAANSVTL